MGKNNPEGIFSKMLKSVGGAHKKEEEMKEGGPNKEKQQGSTTETRKTVVALGDDEQGKLTEKEQKEEGAVTWKSFSFYIKSLGGLPILMCLIFASWTNDVIERSPDLLLVIWNDDLLDLDDQDQYLTIWLSAVAAKFLYHPIGMFGNFVNAMNMMKVTLDRLQTLLMQPEIKPVLIQPVA